MRQTPKLDQAAFTVVEIVVSITIAGIFLTGLAVLVSNLNTVNDRTRDLIVANAFVEDKVEDLRNASFVSLPASTTVVDFTSEMPQTLAAPRLAEYTVTDISTSLKRIDIVINYNNHGFTKVINYSAAIGDLGVGQY